MQSSMMVNPQVTKYLTLLFFLSDCSSFSRRVARCLTDFVVVILFGSRFQVVRSFLSLFNVNSATECMWRVGRRVIAGDARNYLVVPVHMGTFLVYARATISLAIFPLSLLMT